MTGNQKENAKEVKVWTLPVMKGQLKEKTDKTETAAKQKIERLNLL